MPSACPLPTLFYSSLYSPQWHGLSIRKASRSTMSLTFPSFPCTALLPLAQGQQCFHSSCHTSFSKDNWLVSKPCAKEDEMVMSCSSTPWCCSNSWHFTCLSGLFHHIKTAPINLKWAINNTHNHLICYAFLSLAQLVLVSIHLLNYCQMCPLFPLILWFLVARHSEPFMIKRSKWTARKSSGNTKKAILWTPLLTPFAQMDTFGPKRPGFLL